MIKYIKEHWKAIAFVAGLVGLLIVAVLGWHWEETAEKPFWYTIWPYLSIAAIVLFIGGIKWFDNQRKKW